MKNYLIYPAKFMNITQNHGEGNHAAHSGGTLRDYPADDGGADAGRDWFYCPCDEMKIVRIYGVGTQGINTIWMTSAAPVIMPHGEAIVTIMVEHPEDEDLSGLRVGQTFRRGEKMFREGGNGTRGKGTFGNHFHISVGTGQISGNGWVQNSASAWVLCVTGQPLKIDQAFYLEETRIRNAGGYQFQNKPKEERKMDNTPDEYAEEAVQWAQREGILKGSEGDLLLHQNISRQDALVFLHRALKGGK